MPSMYAAYVGDPTNPEGTEALNPENEKTWRLLVRAYSAFSAQYDSSAFTICQGSNRSQVGPTSKAPRSVSASTHRTAPRVVSTEPGCGFAESHRDISRKLPSWV